MAASGSLEELVAGGSGPACCAALYESPAVRWLLGDELHPGGEATTRRALELIELEAGERLLDVGSGTGASAILAARERGCMVAGVDAGTGAVRQAQEAADATGLRDQVGFVVGEASALPFADGEFDAVLCECSLSTFPDQPRAVAEMRRVLRRDGRVVVSDVVADQARLPPQLKGAIGALACVGGALSLDGYERLLAEHDLRPFAVERVDGEAARLAERVEDRLRAWRMAGRHADVGFTVSLADAIDAVRLAQRAIQDGALGYAVIAAATLP
jgi:SAM-dependent methyltransferase